MKKILYLFTGGRNERIHLDPLDYANDFFYGFHDLKEKGYTVDFVERIIPSKKPNNVTYRWLDFHNSWAARKLVMGNNAPFFLPHLKKMKDADIIIAIGDSIALAPELYKIRKWINAKIIHVSMGFANFWREAEERNITSSTIVRWYYNRLLKQADSIVTLGEAENKYLIHKFPKLESKFTFIPFGVDVEFWTPDYSSEKDNDVLFIGNDLRRDYELLKQIPEKLPHLKFTYISSRLDESHLPENVTLLNGSWSGNKLTDKDIRSYYRRSKVLINPIQATLQPSGQSVTLQAMSSGCPVLISDFEGFWEKKHYDSTSITFIDGGSNSWIKKIDELVQDEDKQNRFGQNGVLLTKKHYSSKVMTDKYIRLF